MIKSNKKFADVPVHIYLPLLSPFLIPSASHLLTLVFPLLFFIPLVSVPLFLLIFLNPFPSPLVFSPFCTSLHPSHSFFSCYTYSPTFPIPFTCYLFCYPLPFSVIFPVTSLHLLVSFPFNSFQSPFPSFQSP